MRCSGSTTMRCASKGTVACGRHAAMTSGPTVRFGTNTPSMTSHWIRSTPAPWSAATSSPSREKSAGSTDGTISMGRAMTATLRPFPRCGGARTLVPVTTVELATTGVAAGGDAVARDGGGRVVFVSGAPAGASGSPPPSPRSGGTTPGPS